MTSRGDPKKKLEYAFNIYDSDRNGFLDSNEIISVLSGMIKLMGSEEQYPSARKLTDDCIHVLDKDKDGKVSKGKFLKCLLKFLLLN